MSLSLIKLQKKIINVRKSPEAWIVGSAALIAFLVKILLDLTTLGTNDVSFWWTFSKYIHTKGSFTIYRDIWYYNHPPLVSGWLWLMGLIDGSGKTQFAHLVRLPSIIADIGSTVLIWKLSQVYFDRRIALVVSCIFALNPILMMVSGFHGNTDPVFMFLILLAIYQILIRQKWFISAVILGLATNIKLVPIIMIPAFFFWIRSWKTRIGLVSVALAIVVLGYGYHLYVMTESMIRNVFMYGGLKNIWGIGKFFHNYNNIGKIAI